MSQINDFQDALEAACQELPIVSDAAIPVIKERGPEIDAMVEEALGKLNVIIMISRPELRQLGSNAQLPNYRVSCNLFVGVNPTLKADDTPEMTDVLEALVKHLHAKAAEVKNRAAAWRVVTALPSDDAQVDAYALTVETAFFIDQAPVTPLPITV